MPETYDIKEFQIADRTIRSPKTIEDEVRTQEEREKAAQEVEDVYVFKEEIGQNRVSLIGSIFDIVIETNKESTRIIHDEEGFEPIETKLPLQERLIILKEKLTEKLSEDVTNSIDDTTLTTLLGASDEELLKTKNTVVQLVESIMKEKIREEQVSQVRGKFADQIKTYTLPEGLDEVAMKLGQYAIVANEVYDEQLTEEKRLEAMEKVEPVKILQGQIIVQEGHFIDREIYRQLELLGLLKSNPTKKPLVGLSLFVIIVIGIIYFYFNRLVVPEEKKQNYLVLSNIIFLSSLIVIQIFGLLEEAGLNYIAYMTPVAMMPMLLKILMNERFSLIMTIILAVCGSLIFHDHDTNTINIDMAIYILFSGLSSILLLSKTDRHHILRSSLLVSVTNVIIVHFLVLAGGGPESPMDYFYLVLYPVGSGLISAVLTIGFLPLFESGFGILSKVRLIELANPNHPLLKRLLTDTPGTYHHSIMVANLAEAACEAIGANGLLARVGSYYHDIGKTKRPLFFIENQLNIENPHNQLDPETSRDIILAHTTDGANELKKYKLPKEIVDIAQQHHGTTLLKYFYKKAKDQNPEVKEEDFRYPGPKPQTVECAVICMADSVEAAVRSMSHPTPEQIRTLVHNIVQDKLLDGQFNECNLTLKEIEKVKEVFCETLNGIFHSRIEYPDIKQEKVVDSDTSH